MRITFRSEMNTDKTFIQLVKQCLDERSTINAHTRECYRYSLMYFVRYLQRNAKDPLNPTRAEVNLYVCHLESLGRVGNTINQYIRPVKIVFEWLEAEGIYDNIADRLRLKRTNNASRKRFLSVEQVKDMMARIDRSTAVGARDYAIINMMVRTGMRCCEVGRLDTEDIIPAEAGRYYLKLQRKGSFSKDTAVMVDNKVIDPILSYRDMISDEIKPLFVNLSYRNKYSRLGVEDIGRMIKSRLVKTGITGKGFSPHSLRHTAASLAMKAGANVLDIQVMLGHKRLSTTEIYLSALRQDEEKSYSAISKIDKILTG